MSFEQFKLEVATEQSRGIFNQYVYETDDTQSEVQATSYFEQSRFALKDPGNWFGSLITCKCSDGTFTSEIALSGVIVPIDSDDIVEVVSNYTQGVDDDILFVTGTFTVTMIAPATGIKSIAIRCISGVTTIAPTSGTVEITSLTAGQSITLAPRSTGWFTI